jgi:non-ribosomal peptide synthetase component F
VLHAALATLLHRHGAGDDLPIGTLVAGRGDDTLADLVGCFANTVILRTDTSGGPSFAELLGRVRATTLDALDRCDVPFHDVVAALDIAPPQVMLVHHERADLGGAELGSVDAVPTGTTPAELTVSCYQPRGAGPVPCYLDYAAGVFDRPTAERLAAELVRTVRDAVTDPDRRIRP